MCASHCAQLLHTILHRTDLIVFPLSLQTITTSPMMSIWVKGGGSSSLDCGQLLTICDIVWRLPQGHMSVAARLHFFQQDVQWPWLVQKWFRSAQWRLGRLNPGCRMVESSAREELTTSQLPFILPLGDDVCWVSVCPEGPVWRQAILWRKEHMIV